MNALSRAACRIALALVLAGGVAFAAHAEVKYFHANLTGAQEVPPVATAGTGRADITLDAASKTIAWTVSWKDASSDAVAAHIHGPAAPGANAGVEINLVSAGIHNPLSGTAKVTDAQIADITAGKAYVNVHTINNKGGEMRGQIVSGM